MRRAPQEDFQLKETTPHPGGLKVTSTYDLVVQMQYLYVRVVKAKDLPVKDITGTCDPYVEVKFGDYKGKTRHFETNSNPEWNMVFAFSRDRIQASKLEVIVKDKDFVRNDFMSQVLFDLNEIPIRVPPDNPLAPQWYMLEDKEGYKVKGELMLVVWIGTQADEAFTEAWHSHAAVVTGVKLVKPGGIWKTMDDSFVESVVRANEALSVLKCLDDYFVKPSMATFPGESNHFQPLKDLIQKLRPELTTLLFFFKCVHTWTFLSEQMESLSPIILKIVSFLTNVSEQIVQLEDRISPPSKSRYLFLWFSSKNEHTKNNIHYACERASEWIGLLLGTYESIEALVTEIKQFFVEFGGSFAYEVRSPRHITYEFPWVESYLKSIDCSSYPDLALQISSLNWKLRELVFGFRKLQRYRETEPLLKRCNEVVIGAGFVFCEYWYTGKKLDSDKAKFMGDILLRLQSKVDLWDSQFFDSIVRLLGKEKTTASQDALLDVLLGTACPVLSLKKHVLYQDLKSLVLLLIWITPEGEEAEYMEGLKSLSVSVRKVIQEAGCLQEHMLQEYEVDLLEEIWFLKMDIFLQGQLYSLTGLPLQLEIPLDALKQWMTLVRPRQEKGNFMLIGTLEDEVFSRVDNLVDLSKEKDFQEDVARLALQLLLLKIVLFWAEAFIVKLLNKDEGLMGRVTVRHQIKSLLQGLRFLTMNISYVLDTEDDNSDDEFNEVQLELLFMRTEAVARRVVSLRSSPINIIITEENEFSIHDLLGEINRIRKQLKDIFILEPMSEFPKTDVLGFVHSLLIKLECLPSGLSEYEEHLFGEILSSLKDLTPLLYDMLWQTTEAHEYEQLFTLVTDAAYETEYLIDSMVLGIGAELHNKIRLYHLMEDFKVFHLQVCKLYENSMQIKLYQIKDCEVKARQAAQAATLTFLKDNINGTEEPAVCLNDQDEEVINRLIWGPFPRDIVSIVGMPGIGKTTLARRVYNNLKVRYHFYVRAWCNVSQRYNKIYDKKRLLLEILGHIVGMNEKLTQMAEEDLEFKLHQQLLKKRYLIVLDDVWDIKAWNDLERSFPDDANGSRILMTSRIDDLALNANPNSYRHPVRLMSVDESWNLLMMRIFHDKSCSKELMVVGKQIASNCKGLPLAVVAIAGVLERIEKTHDSWKKIAESLNSMIIDDPETRCRDILELSYKHLPDYLKACFLYFGAFLEHSDIPVSKLICLWIAEGFIQKMASNPLEDLGEAYLIDLMRRSLVIASAERSDGSVKACRIHDLLRDMCLSKAKEENFFKSITRYAEADISFAGLDYGEDTDNSYPSESEKYEVHRLCIFSKRKHFAISRSSGPRVRSLLFFADSDMNPSCPYNLSFLSDNFQLLKVLDLESINVGSSFLSEIVLLMHLRYLAVSGNINSVPSSIMDLTNLETFLVKGLIGKVVLPSTIWCLTKLRHLHVNSHAVFSFEGENMGSHTELYNLVSLSSPLVCYGEDLGKMTARLPNLQKLRFILLDSLGQGSHNSVKLEFPPKLQSLTMTYYGRSFDNVEFSFPFNLKKLSLSNFRLPWSQISVIGRLQNLEVLKLLSRAFEGEYWEMAEGEFSKLRFLKLESLDIARWDASSDHLPSLEQLVLERCELLEEVPYSFTDIPTLKTIQLRWCSHPCEDSARKIMEDVEGLKVVINSNDISIS